jgi:hypothetical protein
MKEEIQPTITDVLASVPFFLLKNVKHAFSFSEQPKPLHPGPPVGGLLAMHPLFMLTEMDRVVRPDMIRYLRACLNWMDEWQGIGQARWLGQGQPGPFRSIADAHTIVWAGMAM